MRRALAPWGTLLFALALALAGGCGTPAGKLTPVAGVDPGAAAGTVTVSGARGPVGAVQQSRTLQRTAAEGGADRIRVHLQALTTTGDVDLIQGNRARLLVDGPQTFAAMKTAIAGARRRILLESYIVEDAGVAAEVATLLLKKAAEGVGVALIYDAVGSISTPTEFFDRLRAGGVKVCAFNPVKPERRWGMGRITHRDHRKLLVVDGDVAYTGGINISRVYGSGSFGRSRRAPDADALKDGWRDTQIELRGPVVPVLAEVFADTWRKQACEGELVMTLPAAARSEPGGRIVKVVASDANEQGNRIYSSLLAAVAAATHSIHLTMAYFAPGRDFVAALTDAARRGVDVQLVLPGRSDFALVLHAGRAYYSQMLDAGVKLYEMEHAMMHAKTAVIDGVFSTVGSSNLDWRSIVSNNELNVIVLGDDFGAEMEAVFERDRATSRAIDAATWARRGLRQRALEAIACAAEPLL